VTEPVLCELCKQPVRSAAARARRIGGRCWRKLTPAQRAGIRTVPARAVPTTDGQLRLDEQESTCAN